MIDQLYYNISNCRVCESKELKHVLSLGDHPPANSLRSNIDTQLPNIPLSLVRCNQCTTIQISVTIKPDYLFKDYVWVTGTSQAAKEYSVRFRDELTNRCKSKRLFVIEIASNDGTFLERFKSAGHNVLGIDPAENIARLANDRNIQTLVGFFGLNSAEIIVERYGLADCIFARNVIPHVENVHDVISGIARCLADDGVGAIEYHYAKTILEEIQYDSIYHEHLCYHSIITMSSLLEKHGFIVFDIIDSPISGGAVVLYFSKTQRTVTQALRNKLEIEKSTSLGSQHKWDEFAMRCQKHKTILKEIITNELANGSKIIAYGASARSSTLLNYCEINYQHLLCIADQNPIKENKYTPGSSIKIVNPAMAFKKVPNVVLLLAWNFKKEILHILKTQYQFKGKVIQPLPNEPTIIHI